VDGTRVVDRPGATFVGSHEATTFVGGRSAVIDGWVGSHAFLVGADGTFDFAAFFGAAAIVDNPTALPVNIVGGSQRADFFNTARLVAAQAFDAQGRTSRPPIGSRPGPGSSSRPGAAVVPEPSALVLVAPAARARCGRPRRRRTGRAA
jgi:hypothetical protein